jgi:hypothetical protein
MLANKHAISESDDKLNNLSNSLILSSTTTSPSCTSSSLSSAGSNSTSSNFRTTYLNEINNVTRRNFSNYSTNTNNKVIHNKLANRHDNFLNTSNSMDNLNEMDKSVSVNSNWVPPNDRELIMRARFLFIYFSK